jgi:hypothetical protein
MLATTAERDAARPGAARSKPVAAVAALNPGKPRPILLAMLPPRHLAPSPRSITDLIEMDVRRAY